MRFFIFVSLFVIVTPSFARMANPFEIVENSQVKNVGGETPIVVSKPVEEKKTWSLVKSWVSKKVEIAKAALGLKDSTPSTEKTPLTSLEISQKIVKEKAEELEETLPEYKTVESERSLENIREAKRDFRKQKFVDVLDAGAPADKSIPVTKVGVPTFSLYKNSKVKSKSGKDKIVKIKIKDIPLLDAGREAKVSAADFQLNDIVIFDATYIEAQKLSGPKNNYLAEKEPWLRYKYISASGPEDVQMHGVKLGDAITLAIVAKLSPMIKGEKSIQEMPYDPMTKNQLKMLAGMILYNKGQHCHVVAGVFDELSKNEYYADEANFHLGICAHDMGFFSESTDRLIKVISKEDSFYTPKALAKIVTNLPREYEVKVAEAILKIKNKKLIPPEAEDDMNYVLAKAMATSRKYLKGFEYAAKVSVKNKNYGNAVFIKGIAQYALGKGDEAINTLTKLQGWMGENNIQDKNLSSLVAVNLGRIFFQLKKYKEAHAEYLKVDKSHSLWVEALIEQAWVQIHLGDNAGAIGNMYSLHSPYFKMVFVPESYSVRTIGYLNICQYGDAYQTLEIMESKFKPWIGIVENYIRKKKTSDEYYATIANYLRGQSTSNVEQIPYQLLREIARQRNFLNVQDSINQKADELDQFNFINGLIIKDIRGLRYRMAQARGRIGKTQKNIKLIKKNNALAANLNKWQSDIRVENTLIANLSFQEDFYKHSQKEFFKMKKRVGDRLAEEKYWLRQKAGRALVVNLKYERDVMKQVLENNEFLRYEVFAGSGENIRYKAAGGDSAGANRLPSSIKPKQTLSWSVTGEYWEDEVGNYRSALKNNCPKNRRIALPEARAQVGN